MEFPMRALNWVVRLGVAYGAVFGLGVWRWSAAINGLLAQLDAARMPHRIARYHVAELEGLPAPVQRYFRAALTDGQSIVVAATLTQNGTFNLSAGAQQWKPLTATQHFVTARPGFVWDAQIRLFPGLPVRVVDALIAGTGLLRPTVLGLVPLGAQHGSGEIARGELLRYLAEAVWFPTALLPSQGVVWHEVDDGSARATLTDGPLTVAMVFHFGGDDLVRAVFVESRAATVGKTTVMLPWVCRMTHYQNRDGMRVPMVGEALYLTPQGERPYFKGTTATLTYEFAP